MAGEDDAASAVALCGSHASWHPPTARQKWIRWALSITLPIIPILTEVNLVGYLNHITYFNHIAYLNHITYLNRVTCLDHITYSYHITYHTHTSDRDGSGGLCLFQT